MEEKFWFIPQRGLWGEGMWKHNGPGDKAHNKCLDTTTERQAKRSNSKPKEFPYKFALTFRFIKSPSIQAPPCHTHPIPPINHFGTYNTRCSFSLMTSFSESCPCPRSDRDRRVQSKFAFSLFLWLSISRRHCWSSSSSSKWAKEIAVAAEEYLSEWMHAKRRILDCTLICFSDSEGGVAGKGTRDANLRSLLFISVARHKLHWIPQFIVFYDLISGAVGRWTRSTSNILVQIIHTEGVVEEWDDDSISVCKLDTRWSTLHQISN